MSDVVAQFADLFEGRRDAYGTEEGGCMRVDKPTPFSWKFYAERHLEGEVPIGVYPMVQRDVKGYEVLAKWFVKWGCVDFDVKTKGKPSWDYEDEQEAHVASVNLQNVLKALGVTAWLERTRSCGRHVWVFSSSWVTAATMRRALLVASSVAGVSSREVNPKQETLGEGQLGNYVRLPYPGGMGQGAFDSRYMIVPGGLDHRSALSLVSFVTEAMRERTSPETLQRIADKYVEPTKPVYTHVAEPYTGNLTAAERLNRAGRSVFLNGDADGDRSRGLAYIAYQARESGLSPTDTYTLLDDAARRWGKFEGRPDREKRLMRYVEGVFR